MADVFSREDAKRLFTNKTIYFIGDSNIRALYKDLLQLLEHHRMMESDALKSKMEKTFNGDKLVLHGEKTNGRNYREERLFQADGLAVLFYFITKCYNEYVESILKNMLLTPPDVVICNSCLWDISRWGPKGVEHYKKNLPVFLKRLQEVLSPKCLFIWATTLPVSQKMKGGFLVQEVDFLRHTLRFDVLEANLFASEVVSQHGFDVIDLHYYIQWQIHRRAQDGIHWLPSVVRHITNLLLTHISLAWDRPLPNNFASRALIRVMQMDKEVALSDFDNQEDQPARKVFHNKIKSSDSHSSSDNRFEPSFTMDFNFGGSMPLLNIGVNPNVGFIDFSETSTRQNLPQPNGPMAAMPGNDTRLRSVQRCPVPQQSIPLNNFSQNPFSAPPPTQNFASFRQNYYPNPSQHFFQNSSQNFNQNPSQNFNQNLPRNFAPYRNGNYGPYQNWCRGQNLNGVSPPNPLQACPWNESPNTWQQQRNKSFWT